MLIVNKDNVWKRSFSTKIVRHKNHSLWTLNGVNGYCPFWLDYSQVGDQKAVTVPIQCLANAKLMNGMKIITTAFEKIEKKLAKN
jgi:hypothetical protein